MKTYILAIFVIISLSLSGQQEELISESYFYQVGTVQLVRLPIDSNSNFEFTYYLQRTFVQVKNVYDRENSESTFDTLKKTYPLIEGQYVNGRKTGNWHYWNEPVGETYNYCFGANQKDVFYSNDTISTYEELFLVGNMKTSYINDSTIIEGIVFNDYMTDKTICFKCDKEKGCLFWFQSSPEKIILSGPFEEFDMLWMAARFDPMRNGVIDNQMKTTSNKK